MPAERARLLTEGLDSLAAHGLADLDYVITLGHSAGHISVLHRPSRTMLAADTLFFVRPSLRLANATADEGDSRVRRRGGRSGSSARHVGARSVAPGCCRVLRQPLRLLLLTRLQVALTIPPWSTLSGLTLRAEPHIVAPRPRCCGRCWCPLCHAA